jgi:hypothetical protein
LNEIWGKEGIDLSSSAEWDTIEPMAIIRSLGTPDPVGLGSEREKNNKMRLRDMVPCGGL